MIDILAPTSLEMRGATALGLSIALKATLLMLVALTVHLLLGQRRPLVRSVIWNACLLGLLLLPISAATFPRLRFSAPRGPAATPAVARLISPPAAAKELAPGVARTSHTIPHPAPIPTSVAMPWRDWSTVVFLAYVAVAAGLIARLFLSLRAVARLRRSSPAVVEPPWVDGLERWRGRLGLACRVRLVRSPRLGVPVVVGWLRPVILLPDTLVKSAAPSTIDAVLLHELTHVRRGDYAWNVLLRLVQAIYWPHPLIWLIGRLVAGVREQACDDLCVSWLGGSATYCATLLEVAAGLFRRPWEALGLAMTRSTKLGRRLARIERSAGAPRCLLRAPARGVIVVAVLAAFGLLGSVTLVRPRADEPKLREQTRDRGVRVERVKQGEIRRTTVQVGSLHAFESAELFAKVSGYLKQQNVDIGDRVKQGDLLAVIDAPELTKDVEHAVEALEQAKGAIMQAEARLKTTQNEAKAAEATVEQAQAEAARSSSTRRFREKESARYKRLLEQKAIPQQLMAEEEEHYAAATAAEQAAVAAVVKAKADVSSALSRVDQARTDLMQTKSGARLVETNLNRAKIMANYTRVVSPYNGVVTFRGFHPGAFIRAPDAGTNIPVLTVARTDKMRVVTYIPDRDVPFLDRGDPAEIRLDALPGQTFRGKVARFAETEDPQSRTMRTEIDLENSGNKLREGMYGTVTIVLDERPGLAIPTTALARRSRDGSGSCVRIVDGRAVLTPIKLGYDDGERAEVLEGLKEGDTVALDPGADRLEPGQAVEVEEH